MSYKDRTFSAIYDYYARNDLNHTIQLASAMLQSERHKDDKIFLAEVHGEINEALLYCILTEYSKTVKCKIYKGLIIKDKDSELLTEIDLLLASEKRIIIFECKCYCGDKVLTKACTIKKQDGSSFDVYKQNHLHAECLHKVLNPFRTENSIGFPAYQLALFNFSLGKTEDRRNTRYKELMPCINENNIDYFLDNLINSSKETVWNYAYLIKALDIIDAKSDDLRAAHLKFVKSLNH